MSPGSLDSILGFLQPHVSMMSSAYKLNKQGVDCLSQVPSTALACQSVKE